MSETLWAVLIASVVGPSLLFILGRLLGGWRRDRVESDASVATQWQAWAGELKARVTALEADVAELKAALSEERDANAVLTEQNRRQSALMSSLIGWALLLRDEVLKLGGSPPPAPPEVQAALTSVDPA